MTTYGDDIWLIAFVHLIPWFIFYQIWPNIIWSAVFGIPVFLYAVYAWFVYIQKDLRRRDK